MIRLRSIRIVLALVVVLVLGCLAIAIHRNTEPRHQGRTLTEWLHEGLKAQSEYGQYRWTERQNPQTNPDMKPITVAIKNIGPDVIPFLLEWSQVDDAPMRTKVVNWLDEHTPLHFHVQTAGERHAMARLGFLLLGDESKSALPALIRLTRARYSEHRYWAFYCLLACQPDRETLLPVLNRLVHDPDTTIQFFAAHVFHDRYPQEAEAAGVYKILPFLKEHSTNSASTTKPSPSK